MFPFLNAFRGITVSAEIGLMKPELAIYRHHEKTFGLDPAATLFFDDSAANVEGARAAGWKAEQFTGADKMRADLARYGVAGLTEAAARLTGGNLSPGRQPV